MTKSRGHGGSSPMWVQVSGTHRCVKDFNPLKVNLERAQMSLFSMKLEKMRTCLKLPLRPPTLHPNP